MEYRLNHTLQLKCKIQKAWSLWQESNAIDKILCHCRKGTFSDGLVTMECQDRLFHKVVKSVIDLPLPCLLKADLCEIIHSMGEEIFEYIRLLSENFYESLRNIEAICIENIFWTEDGIIDKPKSLRYLMENTKHTYPQNFYNLACNYCIDRNFINELWWKIPEDIRNTRYREQNTYVLPYSRVAYWKDFRKRTYSQVEGILNGRIDETNEESIFLYLACSDMNEPAKLCFNKIPEDKRQESLLLYAQMLEVTTSGNAELILFVLSKMNEENRVRTIEHISNKILDKLLHSWPWREFYVSVFDNISCLSKDVFLTIIKNIVETIDETHKSYKLKFQLILSEIWNKNISKEYKKFVNFLQVFRILLKAGDVELVMSIATDKDLQNIPLTCLAFLMIRIKYPHLLEKYENLGIGKIDRKGITMESLEYCLSEFSKNLEYYAARKTVSWYNEIEENN